MIKISIVVPIYNAEKYIKRCIDSLLNQTLDGIEIILVNDASTDKTTQIINEYAEKYSDMIRVVHLAISRHAGGARNVGIEYARGEYVAFVDSDDYIDYQFCELLYNKAKQDNSDIVCCDFYKGPENETKSWITSSFQEQMGDLDYKKRNSILINTGYSWGMIIRKKLLRDNHILFPEKIGCEDYCMRVILFLHAKRISKIDKPLYTYIIYDTSLSHQRNSQRHYDYEKAVDWLEKYIEEKELDLLEKRYIHTAMIRCLLQEMKLLITYFDIMPQEDLYHLGKRAKKLLSDINSHQIFYIMGLGRELDLALCSGKTILEFRKMLSDKYNENLSYDKMYAMLQETVMNQMEQWKCDGKLIYMWGAGKKGKSFLSHLPDNIITAVIDRNSKKWGSELISGSEIISPQDVKDCNCIVILMNRYYYSETKQILEVVNPKIELFNLEVLMSLYANV